MATLTERKLEYDLHKSEGYSFYNTIRSQLSLDMEGGSTTDAEANEISKRLREVKNELLSGDWKSALLEINKVLPNIHLTEVKLSEIKTGIQDYITNNYNW